MRLRSLIRTANVVLAALALLACGSLLVLTTVLERDFRRARSATHSLRAAEAARVELLLFARASDHAYLTPDPATQHARTEAEVTLTERVEEARAAALGEHRALADRARRRVHEYLVARRAAEAKGSPLETVLVEAQPASEAALESFGRLAQAELDEVIVVEERAALLSRAADAIGLGLALLLLFGFAAVALSLNRLVLHPLVGLSDAIRRFGRGERGARAPERGTAELQETAASFNDTAEQLERRRGELLTFLAGVAHDLRNPLNALRLSTGVLAPDQPLPNKDVVRDTMMLVQRQVTRLDRMVGDLLDATRIEAGQLALALGEADACALAVEAAELYRSSSDRHQLLVETPDHPVTIRCDPARIAQVLNNLVSNAIKYSPSGGEVRIRVEEAGGEAKISVIDSGVGIAPEDVDHIFAPFRRATRPASTIPGVGLGLSVARRIAEAHGGRIDVTSRPGLGSTFAVVLPLSPRRASELALH